jgi:hypothetical protein
MEELLNADVNDALKVYLKQKDWLNWRITNKLNYKTTMESFINHYKNRRITLCEYYNFILNNKDPSTLFIWQTTQDTQDLSIIDISPLSNHNVAIFKVVCVEKNTSSESKVQVCLVRSCAIFSLKEMIFAQCQTRLTFKEFLKISIMFDIATSFNIYQRRDKFVSSNAEYAKEMVKNDFESMYKKKKMSLYLLDSLLERNSINCQCHIPRKEYVKAKDDYMYSEEDRDFVVSNLLDYINLTRTLQMADI